MAIVERCAAPGPFRPGLAVVVCLSVLAAVTTFADPQEDPSSGKTPARLFDPRRPPERELETSVDDGFTLAAVGDCIISRPLSPMLTDDVGFAAVVKILRDAGATFGNFENSAIDLRELAGYPQGWGGDWT